MTCPPESGIRITAAGSRFGPIAEDDWDLPWVFRTLSRTPRWLGQAADRAGRRLTVAHHSLWCSRCAWSLLESDDPAMRAGTALWALLHDGHEAWTGDVPRTLQQRMPALLERQERLDGIILERVAAERPGLAAWAGERRWRRELVERIDRTASAAEREFYVDGSGAGTARNCLPASWPPLPGRLPGRKGAASRMAEALDLLAAILEDSHPPAGRSGEAAGGPGGGGADG